MMGYWEPIFIISSFCLGLRAISDDDMVLFPIRKYFIDNYEYWDRFKINLAKPLILCEVCMPSIWGSFIWWGIFCITEHPFLWWTIPVYVASLVSCSFINWFAWATFEWIRKH